MLKYISRTRIFFSILFFIFLIILNVPTPLFYSQYVLSVFSVTSGSNFKHFTKLVLTHIISTSRGSTEFGEQQLHVRTTYQRT